MDDLNWCEMVRSLITAQADWLISALQGALCAILTMRIQRADTV